MTEYMKIKNAILRNFADCIAHNALNNEYTEKDTSRYDSLTTPKMAAKYDSENAAIEICKTKGANSALIARAFGLGTISSRQGRKLIAFNNQGEKDALSKIDEQLKNIIYDNVYYNHEYGRN